MVMDGADALERTETIWAGERLEEAGSAAKPLIELDEDQLAEMLGKAAAGGYKAMMALEEGGPGSGRRKGGGKATPAAQKSIERHYRKGIGSGGVKKDLERRRKGAYGTY